MIFPKATNQHLSTSVRIEASGFKTFPKNSHIQVLKPETAAVAKATMGVSASTLSAAAFSSVSDGADQELREEPRGFRKLVPACTR